MGLEQWWPSDVGWAGDYLRPTPVINSSGSKISRWMNLDSQIINGFITTLDLDQILISSGFWSDFDQTWILIRKQQIPHSRRGDCQDHHHQQHIHHHHPDHHHDETFPVSAAQTGRDFIVNQKLTTLSCCCCYCCYCTVLKTNQTEKLILNQNYLNCFQCTSPPLNWRWTFVFSFKHKFFNLWDRSKGVWGCG